MQNLVIDSHPNFDGHKLVNFFFDRERNLKGYISLHRFGSKVPAFGATRIWNYSTSADALTDSLRLSKCMSAKAALAGLNCGGAKAVIISDPDNTRKKTNFLKTYTDFVNLLGGKFITGADVGVTPQDVRTMRRNSDYIVGLKVDPVKYTALGIFYAIEESLKEIYGSADLTDRSFAIQGVGKIGRELIKLLYKFSRNIYISDIYDQSIKKVLKDFPRLKEVPANEIHKQKVDIFSPCALSNSINKITVKELKCKVIAGGANNQLENILYADIIHKSGILYIPDYIVNAGGLISVFDEYENKSNDTERIIKRLNVIKSNIKLLLAASKKNKKSLLTIADGIAATRYNKIN